MADQHKRLKVIVDTDCGVDDAVAIGFACTESETLDLIAITCCAGNTNLPSAVFLLFLQQFFPALHNSKLLSLQFNCLILY
jgi:inosine-uridine nucleoside N-ribohydrolase